MEKNKREQEVNRLRMERKKKEEEQERLEKEKKDRELEVLYCSPSLLSTVY